jgi:hypothetical protein
MACDQRARDDSHLAVELQEHVLAEYSGHPAHPGDQGKLEGHDRKGRKTARDAELHPERPAAAFGGPRRGEHERQHHKQKIAGKPQNHSAQTISTPERPDLSPIPF